MSKVIIGAVIVVVVVIGGWLLFGRSSAPIQTVSPSPTAEVSPTPTPSASPTESMVMPTLTATPKSSATRTPMPSSHVSVSIMNFAFNPGTITVHKDTTVIWTNNDNVAHTVTGNNGGPASSNITPGTTYSYTFNTVGTFPYHCAIHPSMLGTVQVTN